MKSRRGPQACYDYVAPGEMMDQKEGPSRQKRGCPTPQDKHHETCSLAHVVVNNILACLVELPCFTTMSIKLCEKKSCDILRKTADVYVL